MPKNPIKNKIIIEAPRNPNIQQHRHKTQRKPQNSNVTVIRQKPLHHYTTPLSIAQSLLQKEAFSGQLLSLICHPCQLGTSENSTAPCYPPSHS